MKRRRRIRVRVLLFAFAGVLAALIGVWFWLTNPSRLRFEAETALQAAGFADARVGHAAFSLGSGLELSGVDIPLSPRPSDTPGQPHLRVQRTKVKCSFWPLLAGRVEPKEILLDGVEARFVRSAGGGETGWERVGRDWRRARALELLKAGTIPTVRIENGDVEFVRIENGVPRLLERWLVRGLAEPTEDGYALRLRRIDAGGRRIANVEWAVGGESLRIAVDEVDLETLALFLPGPVTRLLGRLEVRGAAALEECELNLATAGQDPLASVQRATLRLNGVGLQMRIEERDCMVRDYPRDRAAEFARVDAAQLRVQLDRPAGQLALTASGVFEDAQFALQITGPDSMLEQAVGEEGVAAALDRAHMDLQLRDWSVPEGVAQLRQIDNLALPIEWRIFLKDFQPGGRFDIDASICAASAQGAGPRLTARVRPLGARCRYHRFPYAIEDVRGELRIEDELLIANGLHGRHGAGRIRMDGIAGGTRPWSALDLRIQGENIALDRYLFGALPAEQRAVWRACWPLGICDISTHITRPELPAGSRADPDIAITARLRHGSLNADRQRRLEDAVARISIERGRLTVHDLQGTFNEAFVRAAGQGWGGGRTESHGELWVQAAGVHIEDAGAANAVGLGSLTLHGTADVWGEAGAMTGDATGLRDYTARITSGRLTNFAPGAPWTTCQGWVSSSSGGTRLHGLHVADDASSITARGSLPRNDSSGQFELTFDAASGAVERLCEQIVPPEWRAAVQRLNLSGPGRIESTLARTDLPGASPAVDLRLTCAAARPELLPLPLRNVALSAQIEETAARTVEASAEFGEGGSLRLAGGGSWTQDHAHARFSVAALRAGLTPDLIAALPRGLADVLRRTSARGVLDMALDRVEYTRNAQHPLECHGAVAFQGLFLALGLPLENAQGKLTGQCLVDGSDQVEIDAALSLVSATLGRRALANWEGRLRRPLGSTWVSLEELSGQLCDGDGWGWARVDPVTGEYEWELNLLDANLDQLLARKDVPGANAAADTANAPRVDGRVFLRGFANGGGRRGGGELTIRGGSFLRTPVLRSVADASREKKREVQGDVDSVRLRFDWSGNVVDIRSIEIDSHDLRLVGTGTWSMADDRVALELLGAPPRSWPRVAVLSELIEAAGNELLMYRVEGTFAAPRVRIEPLHNLSAALASLFDEP